MKVLTVNMHSATGQAQPLIYKDVTDHKLQYYDMAHRLSGYAEGLDEKMHDALVHLLMKSETLLEEAWDEYQASLPPDQRIWTWDDKALKITLDDDTIVQLNPIYVIGVVWREELEPEQPELWDVEEDESETDGDV